MDELLAAAQLLHALAAPGVPVIKAGTLLKADPAGGGSPSNDSSSIIFHQRPTAPHKQECLVASCSSKADSHGLCKKHGAASCSEGGEQQ